MAINFPDASGLSDGYSEVIDEKLYTLTKISPTVFYWTASTAENPDNRYVNITGDTMTGDLTVPSMNVSPLAGFRNQIINGNFRINQRNGTRTPGVGVYGFDRWKGNAGGLEQVVEALPAGEYTLSWTGGGNGTFGGTTATSPITATVIAGDTSVVVPSNATSVQLEPGPVSTPFELRPFGTELTLCQRYYEKSYTQGVAPGTIDNAGSEAIRQTVSNEGATFFNAMFAVEKRDVPVVVWYSPNNGSANLLHNVTIGSLSVTGTSGASPESTKSPGAPLHTAIGSPGDVIIGHWTADADF